MISKARLGTALFTLFAFLIPIEHKYDKTLRRFSEWLLPTDLQPWHYETKIALYATDFLILILLFIYRVPLQRFLSHPIWLVLVCAFLSILASPFAHYPVPYFHLFSLFTPMALFMLFRHQKVEDLKPILIALIAAGTIQSCIAIAQYFHQGPLGLYLLGESKHINGTVTVTNGAIWVFDSLFGIVREGVSTMRAMGTLTHPNVLGGYLLLPIAAIFALGRRSTWLLPLFIFALFLSYSRSALLGLSITSFLFLCLQKQQALRPITIVISSALLCGALLYPTLSARAPIAKEVTGSNRVYYQNFAWTILQKHPALGLGYKQYFERAKDLLPPMSPEEYTAPHNLFLLLACETGLFSLAAVLLSGLLLLRRAIASPMTREHAAFCSLFIAFCIVACCDLYFWVCQAGRLTLFLSASLLAHTSYATLFAHEQRRELENVRRDFADI